MDYVDSGLDPYPYHVLSLKVGVEFPFRSTLLPVQTLRRRSVRCTGRLVGRWGCQLAGTGAEAGFEVKADSGY